MADSVGSGAELLTLGPRRLRRRQLQGAVALGLVLLLCIAVLVAWRALRPPPGFTAEQVRDAYSGMIQRAGTSYLYPVGPDTFTDLPVTVRPSACAPLFTTTVSNLYPAAALDGISANWVQPGRPAVELMTLRYPETGAAQKAYAAVSRALPVCSGESVTFSRHGGTGLVRVLPATPWSVLAAPDQRSRADRVRQAAYLLDLGHAGRFAISVSQLRNTLTWQYRNVDTDADATAWAVQSLNDSMLSQLVSVAAH